MKTWSKAKVPPPVMLNEQCYLGGPATALIMGIARGGTSVTAGIVDALGVPVASQEFDGHYETPQLKADLTDPGCWGTATQFINEQDVISHWGAQLNANPDHLRRVAARVCNPHLIVVFRDMVGLIQSHLHTKEWGENTAELLRAIPRETANLHTIATVVAELLEIPTLLLSFDRLMGQTEITAHHIADFLHIEPTDEQYAEAVSRVNPNRGYLQTL